MNIYDQNYFIDNLDAVLSMLEVAKDRVELAEDRIAMMRKTIWDLPVPKED